MRFRSIVYFGVLVALIAGCDKKRPGAPSTETVSSPTGRKAESDVPNSDVRSALFFRAYWAGSGRIIEETHSSPLTNVLHSLSSIRLKADVVEKATAALARALPEARETNQVVALMQPLVEDVVRHECYFEMPDDFGRQEVLLAVRLASERQRLWRTNLQSLGRLAGSTGDTISFRGFSLELTNAGDWTLVSFRSAGPSGIPDLSRRLVSDTPGSSVSNKWFMFEVNGARIAEPPFPYLTNVDRLDVSFAPDGDKIRTVAEIILRTNLVGELTRWNIPTNLIDSSFVSFAAIRGLQPVLTRLGWRPEFGEAPNQLFIWSTPATLMQTYLAAPLANASNQVQGLSDWIIANQERIFPNRDVASFVRSESHPGLEWRGFPFMSPMLSIPVSSNFAVAGTFPFVEPSTNMPVELVGLLESQHDLIGYSWEVTGARIEQLLYVGQFLRVVFEKGQLPAASPSVPWLQDLVPHLGPSITEIRQTSPGGLVLTRKSSLGFDAAELHLLADWFASPAFPFGLHTSRTRGQLEQ